MDNFNVIIIPGLLINERFTMSKVYDCFLFSYNPDLLEIRLNILNDVVDKFVIVESPYGWNRNFKGMVFTKEENLKRFEKFLHKIEYVPFFDMPSLHINPENPDEGPQKLEIFNRNTITRGLKDVSKNDIVLISDFDEIPDPEMIKKYKDSNTQNPWSFTLPSFWYKLNCLELEIDRDISHTIMFRGRLLNHYTPQQLRFLRKAIISTEAFHDWTGGLQSNPLNNSGDILDNLHLDSSNLEIIYHGGWHFSWSGNEELVNEKLNSYSHQHYRNDIGRKLLAANVKSREEMAIVSDTQTTYNLPIDSFFPQYLVDNQDKYSHLISKAVGDQSGHELKDKIYN